MAEDNTGKDPNSPAAKKMRQMNRSFYFEPKVIVKEKEVTATKKTFYADNTNWTIWVREAVVDKDKVLKIHFKYEAKYIFADKLKLKLKLVTDEYPEGKIMTFDIENSEERRVFEIKVPQNMNYHVFVSDFYPDIGEIRFGNIKYDFADPSNPHDIVLNFGDKKLYCNKVFLALWSNYFDRLFFSETADKDMTSCDLPDLKAEVVMYLLNHCIVPWDIFKNYVRPLRMMEIHTIFILEMWPFEKKTNYVNFGCQSINRYSENTEADFFNNILICLELSEKHKLDHLQKDCTKMFHKLPMEQKKRFFAENEDRLNKLKMRTFQEFVNNGKIPDALNELLADVKKESTSPIYEKNITKLTDVTLVVGKKRFKVHKEYLAFWSRYFDRLFFGGFSETGKDEIELKEIDPAEFSVLLKIIYPPRKRVDYTNYAFLLKLADRFEMKGVKKMCATYLVEIDNSFYEVGHMNILEISETYNLIDAQRACFESIGELNFYYTQQFRRWNRFRIDRLGFRMIGNLLQAIAIEHYKPESESEESDQNESEYSEESEVTSEPE